MNQEEIDNFEQSLMQSLFHVMSDDKDENGASLEEVILIQHLAAKPEMLQYKPLKQWVDEVVGKCWKEDVKKANEEYLKNRNVQAEG